MPDDRARPLLRVLGLIPARGGSRGIPRKNIRPLLGKSLLRYTAEAALAARRLARVVLSTEDEEIADEGRRCGLGVPFMRPPALAGDDTPTLPVVQHALRMLEGEGERFDAACLLQPTSPIRPDGLIDACVALLETSGADAVVTVLPVPDEHNPQWAYFGDGSGRLRLANGEDRPLPRRQELRPAFHREGSVYVTRRDVLMDRESLYGRVLLGYPVEPGRSVNIDGPSDWERAEALLAEERR